MKNLLFIFLLFGALSAQALDRITATISFTNTPANNDTITVNGSARTWKTTVTVPATQIAVINSAANSATNYFNQIIANAYTSPLVMSYVNATNIQLVADSGSALTVSASGTYATITLSTQVVANASSLNLPLSSEVTAWVRTNKGSQALTAINDYATNTFDATAKALTNHVNISQAQTITGAKTYTGANTYSSVSQFFTGGSISNVNLLNVTGISGSLSNLTNGTFTNPISTNLVNYGNAISSPGAGASSEQFGAGASSRGQYSTAIGNLSSATNTYSVAVGYASLAEGDSSSVYGAFAQVRGVSPKSTAFGFGASIINASNATAIGNAESLHDNSIAIGNGTITDRANQVKIGNIALDVTIGGLLEADKIKNANLIGTNTLDGDLSFTRKNITSLANGANSISASTNLYLKVSGPSGAFSINGISGGRDGRMIKIQNSTGFTMTIANDSGTEPTAANRILTGSGSDYANANNPGMVTLIYDSATSRWILDSHN